MRERPILMNGPMVRATLDGRKRQTRRLVKLPPAPNHLGEWKADTFSGTDSRGREHPEQPCIWHTRTGHSIACPHGTVGDRLWVRETWAYDGGDEMLYQRSPNAVEYRATSPLVDGLDSIPGGRWRPSIHLPRWASRITLGITRVRVERLQDISYEDAIAEGALHAAAGREQRVESNGETWEETARRLRWPQRDFEYLWKSVYGPEAWESNPWVWVIDFTPVTP